MEFNKINKFVDKTNEDLMACEQKIQNWNQFIKDYKSLEERLSTLADKTTHEIMVPIGGSDLAFMPGFVHHTNEILVLLGDNYFVERSAKQAVDIVGRRLTKCQKMIEELTEEKQQLQNWLSFSQQISVENKGQEFVEIVEEYDEQKEELWRQTHRQRVKEYKLSEKMKTKESDDSTLIQKLERLEVQENSSQELKLKSILKQQSSLKSEKSVDFDDRTEMISEGKELNPLPEPDRQTTDKESDEQSDGIAFKNEIKERDIEQELPESIVTSMSSPKIVSRFKANRMKK